MRYLNKYNPIKESIDDNFNLCESILELIKSQNPIVEDVEDIMLDIQDSWKITVIPWYELSLTNDDGTSDVEISRYNDFIKKYKIDSNGQVELSNLIRDVNKK